MSERPGSSPLSPRSPLSSPALSSGSGRALLSPASFDVMQSKASRAIDIVARYKDRSGVVENATLAMVERARAAASTTLALETELCCQIDHVGCIVGHFAHFCAASKRAISSLAVQLQTLRENANDILQRLQNVPLDASLAATLDGDPMELTLFKFVKVDLVNDYLFATDAGYREQQTVYAIGRQHFSVLAGKYHRFRESLAQAHALGEPTAAAAAAIDRVRGEVAAAVSTTHLLHADASARAHEIATMAAEVKAEDARAAVTALRARTALLSEQISVLDARHNDMVRHLKSAESIFKLMDARFGLLARLADQLLAFQNDFVAKVLLLTNLETQYNDHLANTNDAVGDMRALMQLYERYLSAYAPMVAEIARRRAHDAETSQLVAAMREQLHGRAAEETARRQEFFDEFAVVLPDSLWPEIGDDAVAFTVVPVGADGVGSPKPKRL